MPTARGQTGFQPPARDIERRAFFDLLRRIKVLEDGGGGGGGTGTDEVFIGTSDPGATYELWYDTDAPSAAVPGLELAAAYRSTDLTVTASASVTAQVILSTTQIPITAGDAIQIEFHCMQVVTGDSLIFELHEDATLIAIIGTTGVPGTNPVFLRTARRTPSAGMHSYTIKVYRGAVNGTLICRSGTGGAQMPAYLRVVRA